MQVRFTDVNDNTLRSRRIQRLYVLRFRQIARLQNGDSNYLDICISARILCFFRVRFWCCVAWHRRVVSSCS